jgi:hypothetical protein
LKKTIPALLAINTLNILDVALTKLGLALGAVELNPLYQTHQLIIKLSLPVFFSFIFYWACYYVKREYPKYLGVLWIVLALLVLFYSYVVINNFVVVWRLI